MNKPHLSFGRSIYTLDLQFLNLRGAIASYLIPYRHGVVLVESGPGSTITSLQNALGAYGYTTSDITDVLLTHIHLDHAGAAGWLARQGAKIYVHPAGAPHMLNPDKLLASAQRIYGDQMHTLWGEFLSVPESQLITVQDEDIIEIDDLRFRALETPGHANHHYVYVFENICFTGDIGGIRLSGQPHLRLPMPPPEFILEKWRESLARIIEEYKRGSFTYLAPTHFGIFSDPEWHLANLADLINEVETWIEAVMPGNPNDEELLQQFLEWTNARSMREGLAEQSLAAYEAANPSWMSPLGIRRYWNKFRAAQN